MKRERASQDVGAVEGRRGREKSPPVRNAKEPPEAGGPQVLPWGVWGRLARGIQTSTLGENGLRVCGHPPPQTLMHTQTEEGAEFKSASVQGWGGGKRSQPGGREPARRRGSGPRPWTNTNLRASAFPQTGNWSRGLGPCWLRGCRSRETLYSLHHTVEPGCPAGVATREIPQRARGNARLWRGWHITQPLARYELRVGLRVQLRIET